ncbi:MAG: hypothetical protein HC853_15940 [Anaerolineae bacterium]|nr:hypothetical protein [Anaerolineae bacterium]
MWQQLSWQQLSTFLFYAGVGIIIVGFFLVGMPRPPRGDDYVTPVGADQADKIRQRRIRQVFIISGSALLLIGLSVLIQVLT